MTSVSNAELTAAVWAEGDILIVDPRHNRLLYSCKGRERRGHTTGDIKLISQLVTPEQSE